MRRIGRILVFLTVSSLVSKPAWAGPRLKAYWKDDFILESADKRFMLKIRGNVHLDARLYQAEKRGVPHSFDIRRARIDLQGRIYKYFTFRIQPEMAGKPYIRNAWLDVAPFSWLHIRLGQMKVPFSSSWLTLDNNVNFVERGTSAPIIPFFDRGLILWGELLNGTLVYNVGVFTGAGVDLDVRSGDIDDFKDIAARFFLQPLKLSGLKGVEGIYLAAQTTWGRMSVPTSRYETGGLRSANYETAIWRWQTEQVIGTDGRVTDKIGAQVKERIRVGAEFHYLVGPFTLSTEYLELRYRRVSLFHDFFVGTKRTVHERLYLDSGVIRSLSVFASVYVTGEHKRLTNGGWKTARPKRPVGKGGPGAWEILLRYSRTWTDKHLFTRIPVAGFDAGSSLLPVGYTGATPGAGNSVTASILDGAHDVHEFSAGLCWTVNPMVRVQLNNVFLWAPNGDRDGDGQSDNKLVSGAKSSQSDPAKKNTKSPWENAVMLRVIFKL